VRALVWTQYEECPKDKLEQFLSMWDKTLAIWSTGDVASVKMRLNIARGRTGSMTVRETGRTTGVLQWHLVCVIDRCIGTWGGNQAKGNVSGLHCTYNEIPFPG